MINTYPVRSNSRPRQIGSVYDSQSDTLIKGNQLFSYFSNLSKSLRIEDIKARGIDIMNMGDIPEFDHYVWLQDPSTNGINAEASFTLFDRRSGTIQGEMKPKIVGGKYIGIHVFLPKEILE